MSYSKKDGEILSHVGSFRQRASQHQAYGRQMPTPPPPDTVEQVEDKFKGGWIDSEQHKFRFLLQEEREDRPSEKIVQVSDLSPDQLLVYDDLNTWFSGKKGNRALTTLGGFAGTGKSTVISVFARNVKARVAYCAFTGKAANVLKQKLRANGAHPSYVGTIHSLIYKAEKDNNDNHVGFKLLEFLDYDLLVVDEASMLSKEMIDDLCSFEIPVLAVGDHGQLPPIEGEFNLMERPELRLEKVHRQAEGNPIIRLSAYIREHGCLPDPRTMDQDPRVSFVRPSEMRTSLSTLYTNAKTGYDLSNIAVLCYSNQKRRMANNLARELRWQAKEDDPPKEGDILICLRNALNLHLFNGMRARILYTKDAGHLWYYNHVLFDEENLELKGMMFKPQFNRNGTIKSYDDVKAHGFNNHGWIKQLGLLFDYGYALTVHKAQGSSYKDVALLYERPGMVTDDNFRRFLYTAVTRASERLMIVTK